MLLGDFDMKIFGFFVLFLVLFVSSGMVRIANAAVPSRTIKVGAYNNSPKIYKDNYDNPAGVWVDLLNYIAQKENWNLEYVFGTWEEGLKRLESGQIDVVPDMAISPERERLFDFTNQTVLNSWGVVYVRKGSGINSIRDLEGLKISILKSSIYESSELDGIKEQLNAYGVKATIVEVRSDRETLDLLELGQVDAAVVGNIFGIANEKDYKNIVATKIYLTPTQLRFALTKGDVNNPYLIERLDYWVKSLRDGYEGFYNKTLEKYGLGEIEIRSVKQILQKEVNIPTWGYVVFGFFVGLLPWIAWNRRK